MELAFDARQIPQVPEPHGDLSLVSGFPGDRQALLVEGVSFRVVLATDCEITQIGQHVGDGGYITQLPPDLQAFEEVSRRGLVVFLADSRIAQMGKYNRYLGRSSHSAP